MPRSLGQSWPQSTISLQSQEKNCLTAIALFPAGVSSSDEESSSSLLSTFTPEFVVRERLAAAQKRAMEKLCERISHIKMASGLHEGPSRQGPVPSPHLPQHHCHCPCNRQGLCSSAPSFSPPPRQGTCQDLRVSKVWSPADESEPQHIRDTGFC